MVMAIKSCLKHTTFSPPCGAQITQASSRSSTARPSCSRSVSFAEKVNDEVHPADDWDRTPVDIAPKLSYDDILELKQMQVAAARACARAHAANGSTSRFLCNVPMVLLPLLPESPAPTLPAAPTSPTSSYSTAHSASGDPFSSSFSLSLADACLCKAFSADTGMSARGPCGHSQSCKLHSSSGKSTNTRSSTHADAGAYARPSHPQTIASANANASLFQTPSPPNTPPRPLVTSIPPPPPTRKARNFTFLPLLDTPVTTPVSTPSASGLSSPAGTLSPSASSAALSPSSSSSSLPEIGSAYGTYSAFGSFMGVGKNATLGLERKLGFGSSSDSSPPGSDSELDRDEDEDWPHDWPGARRSIVHHPFTKGDVSGSRAQTSAPALPPSPPAEYHTLSSTSPRSPPRSGKSLSPLRVSSPPTGCAAAPRTPSSPSSPGSRELSSSRRNSGSRERTGPAAQPLAPSQSKTGGRKMMLPLVVLA